MRSDSWPGKSFHRSELATRMTQAMFFLRNASCQISRAAFEVWSPDLKPVATRQEGGHWPTLKCSQMVFPLTGTPTISLTNALGPRLWGRSPSSELANSRQLIIRRSVAADRGLKVVASEKRQGIDEPT